MCQKRGFCQKPQNWPKMPNLPKSAKNVIFAKNPKNDQKTPKNRECAKVFGRGTRMW
jgi:hypothetical protein